MKFSLVLALILIAGAGFAQSYSNAGIRGTHLRSSGEIVHNNQVKGYWLFYDLERANSRLSNFMLTVLDENLVEINSVTITRSPSFAVLEISYNGTHFAVLGYDNVNGSIEIIGYDDELKQTGVLQRVIAGYDLMNGYGSVGNSDGTDMKFIVPVSNEGFLLYSVTEEKIVHYQIEFFTNEMKSVWIDRSPKEAKIELAYEGFQDSHYIGSLIEKRKKSSSKSVEYDLVVSRTDNGERVFRVPIVSRNYNVTVSDVQHDTVTGDFIVFGEYYPVGAKETRDESLGFMSIVYDKTGNVLAEQVNSWVDLSKVTPLNEKGTYEGTNTHILFHSTVRTSDGQVFVIGEEYRKALSGTGVAANIISGVLFGVPGAVMQPSSVVQINIYDIVVFQFNPDFTINKVHRFEKKRSVSPLPQGFLSVSPKLVSNYMKSYGVFDYRFTQMSHDNSGFIVTYVDYDRSQKKSGASPFVVGSIVYTPEKTFVVDKFGMQSKSPQFAIMKAKPGYLLVSEYFPKEMKLETRLEKVNY